MAPSTGLVCLKIKRHVNVVVFYRLGVFSKVVMGIMNTSKACKVIEIRVISIPIPIWCGVKSNLIDKNSKYLILLSNTMNEGLTSSTCSLANLSLPLTCSLVIVAT